MAAANEQLQAFRAALDQTQYLSADKLRTYQRRLLEHLLRHARAETAFYAERLAPLFRADDSIDWERWGDIPVLTRTQAQAAGTALEARTIPPVAGKVTERTTSGSTAEPFRHQTTALQNLGNAGANERALDWHGLDPSALTAFITAGAHPLEKAARDGQPAALWRAAHPESRGIDLSIATPVDEQVRWLLQNKPRVLSTYPTNMREIGAAAEAAGTPLHFEALLTNGEMTSDETRADIIRFFGTRPIDRYGSTEAGFIAGTCPQFSGYHVAAELMLLEILDEDGRPAPPGAAGRIVVTPFYSLAMPLIRYDMGDYAAFAETPCPCGRSLPLLERIYGRRRNMFRFPDGKTIWPVLESSDVQAFVPHRRFQVVQVAPTLIEYRYIPREPGQTNDADGLTRYARQHLHPDIEIRAVPLEDLPRSTRGKFEDYICLI